MFKKIIAPVQAWLLAQGKCVGCGKSLEQGKRVNKAEHIKRITCQCGRIFIFDEKTGKYRRALFEEV